MNDDDRFKTFWRRFWAGMVDALLLLPLEFIHPQRAHEIAIAAAISWIVVWTLVPVAYNVLLHWRYGQTLGKMITGVRVVTLAEEPLSLARAFVRDIPMLVFSVWSGAGMIERMLSADRPFPAAEESGVGQPIFAVLFGAWLVLELVVLLANRKRRAVHDFIAGTVVIRCEPRRFAR